MIFRQGITLVMLLSLTGCAGFQVPEDIQSGRQDLLLGKAEQALIHFRRAAELKPHYVTRFTEFREGVWTYVGRAYYDMGEFQKARRALKRALEENKEDPMAHFYLGLVLLRQREVERGLDETVTGLRSLEAWLEFMDHYDITEIYWDPGLIVEREIKNVLARIDDGVAPGREVTSELEYVGKEFEELIIYARDYEEFLLHD